MTEPSSSAAQPPVAAPVALPAPAGERGWGKLILAFALFIIIPALPQFRALVPVDHPMLLFVPALAACAVLGWWAGGRPILAVAWVALATWVAVRVPQGADAFYNLTRGWSLVLAGSFGLVCLFGARRSFFPRAMIALTISLALALMMSVVGPVSGNHISSSVSQELVRRNTETMRSLNTFIGQYPKEWNELVQRVPKMAQLPADTEKQLGQIASAGRLLYPSLLALESIVALALAWSVYHRIARARLGPPLGALRDFRFNDQLVWGLIVGLTIVFLPTLSSVRILGRNLLVFFGALYAVRGLGVLSWFMAPGALALSATVGFIMLLLPILNAIAVLGFMFLGIAAFGLGLGDTWADWRNRARKSAT